MADSDNDEVDVSSNELDLDSCSSLPHPLILDKQSNDEDGCNKYWSIWGLLNSPN